MSDIADLLPKPEPTAAEIADRWSELIRALRWIPGDDWGGTERLKQLWFLFEVAAEKEQDFPSVAVGELLRVWIDERENRTAPEAT